MESRETGNAGVELGRGTPLSGEALRGLAAAVSDRGPVADWVRYRLLSAVLTAAILVWCGATVVARVAAPTNVDDDTALKAAAAATADNEGGLAAATRPASAGGLRNDLFRVPQRRQPKAQAKPKTNPMELLELIELQAVLTGNNPPRYRHVQTHR